MLIGTYDNIGFRKWTGYVQFVMMAILFYSVYPDPRNKNFDDTREQCLSQERWDWDEAERLEPGLHRPSTLL